MQRYCVTSQYTVRATLCLPILYDDRQIARHWILSIFCTCAFSILDAEKKICTKSNKLWSRVCRIRDIKSARPFVLKILCDFLFRNFKQLKSLRILTKFVIDFSRLLVSATFAWFSYYAILFVLQITAAFIVSEVFITNSTFDMFWCIHIY